MSSSNVPYDEVVAAVTTSRGPVILHCRDCGIELDQHDIDANLATWGELRPDRLLCSDDIEGEP